MVDRMVKKEVEQHDEQTVTLGFYGDEQAQRRFSINMMDKQNKATDNKNKVLNSDIKPVTNGEAQKFASSMKATTAEATSSRGEAKSSAVIRAEEIRSSLQGEYPSFVKSLVRSHVASCFWMGLPVAFCKKHLADKDTTMTLEDEYGKEYKMKYIACKTGLSAGWRQFSAVHKLQEGDVLVFQLVEPAKFKIYIVRADNLREVDGALSLMNLDSYARQKQRGKPCFVSPCFGFLHCIKSFHF
nr:B3 domain-containing protein At5g42700 [Arachis hypogaea]